jgi:hypothetical protein
MIAQDLLSMGNVIFIFRKIPWPESPAPDGRTCSCTNTKGLPKAFRGQKATYPRLKVCVHVRRTRHPRIPVVIIT